MIRFLLLLVPIYLSADVQKFNFQCVVSEQVIIEMNDGKTDRFDSYRDNIDVGDRFYIEMQTERFGKEDKNFSLGWFAMSLWSDYPLTLSHNKIYSRYAELTEYIGHDVVEPNDEFSLKTNKIEIWSTGKLTHSGIQALSGQKDFLHIERYYKDDYEMVYMSKSPSNTSWVIHANCMNNKEFTKALDTLFASVRWWKENRG